MTARRIDGVAAARAVMSDVAAHVAARVAAGHRPPCLAVVLVGDDPASQVYVGAKTADVRAAGMRGLEHRLPAETGQAALEALVTALAEDPDVDGILVQLPLPGGLDAAPVIARIPPGKDVDGLTVANAGRLAAGLPGLVPCTPLGCVLLAREAFAAQGGLAGRRALVIGRSSLVGKPLALLLLAEDMTVTLAHSKSRDLPGLAREAELLVAAVGRPELVRGDWVRDGAVVIDVGINRLPPREPGGKARLVGDVAYAEAAPRAAAITPVPGGVGPMTRACLLRNTLAAAAGLAG